ncbi:DUF2057 domain-containing protein [Alkalimarinus alittae]|uniref:DUF2057 domain-containing protein n=1 Tax=Alkalimarinus alittae TaxID=2961619 RepID=A0ABY6N0I9_9ALTE|nr:DUF2057 domain-containing protein [Alkalimarinus alittae]UZE95616.1 DUF2057 domain-containing protein [Alkalimarinus alittae]
MLVLGKLQRVWLSLLVLLVMSGCSSTSLVKTYDGPQVDPSRSAVLSVSDGIEVLSVNGKEVKKYLIPELDLNYQLLPGVNVITFTHETLWAKPGKKEIGESNAELIVTKPMMIRFNAKVGEVYRFNFESPENKRAARANVDSFKATLVDSSDRFVAESTLYVEGDATENTAAVAATAGQSSEGNVAVAATAVASVAAVSGVASETSMVAPTAVPVRATATQGGALPTIDALKVLWDSASTDEKKAFLKWAFK